MSSLRKNRILYFFAVPLLVVGVYLYFFASDIYVSEAQFVIQKDKETDLGGLDLGVIAAVTGTAVSNYDSMLIRNLIESMGMLTHLQSKLDIKSHYSNKSIDFYARLDPNASMESFFDYYQDFVEVEVEDLSSVVTLKVKAFSPEEAQQIAQDILHKSEDFVNEIGQNLGREQTKFMEWQVGEAETRVNEANQELIKIQNRYDLLTPETEAATLTEVIGVLESELAIQKTQLKQLQSFLNPKAPEIVSLKARISALENQLATERQRQTGKGRREVQALNEASIAYQDAQQDVQFALSIYQSALKSLENARLDASKKVKYLVVISPPNLPQEALYPRRFYILSSLAALLLLLYGIARLAIATIEDHRD